MTEPRELKLQEPPLRAEWRATQNVDRETWLVIWDGSNKSSPRAFQASSEKWVEHPKPPFQSLVRRRFRQAVRAPILRAVKALAATAASTCVALIVIASLSGALQLRLAVSDSMAGTFERGALLAVVSPQFAPVKEGSIVVFHYYNEDRSLLVGDFSHRVMGGNDEIGWQTKGDANESADQSLVLRQDIVGTVIGWIPNVGIVLQPTNVLAFLLLVMLLGILRPDLSELLASRRKN